VDAFEEDNWVLDIAVAGGLTEERYIQCVRMWMEISNIHRDKEVPVPDSFR
jgi:hypothetical protein